MSTPVFPNLAGVITLSDIKQKGSGSYAADYIPWAKVMQLINQHANGWVPRLAWDHPDELGTPVHKAPNGTGYLLVYFEKDEQQTTFWPFAITDNRNNPIPFDKISARDLADSHRRAICSAAAAFFSLAFELWAREEVMAVSGQTIETQPEPQLQQDTPKGKPAVESKKKGQPSKPPVQDSHNQTVIIDELIAKCMDLIQAKLDRTAQVAWIADKATKWSLDADGSKLKQMNADQLQICIDELSAMPALKS